MNKGNIRFLHTIKDDRVEFSLVENDKALPIGAWPSVGHAGALSLLGFFQNHGRPHDQTSAVLPVANNDLMSWLDGQEKHAQKISGLPPLFDGALVIESEGTFHLQSFSIKYSWQKANSGGRYTRADEQGCFITVAGEVRLLQPHAWHLRNAIKEVQERLAAANDVTEKMLEWHEIQKLLDLLPERERDQALHSSVLRKIRLSYANAFQLEAIPTADGYDITPVLLQQRILDVEGEQIEHQSLLTLAEQEAYTQFFAKAKTIPSCTALDVGRYVILNKEVQKVLQYVQEVRQRPAKERLEFLKNPRASLSTKFEKEIEEDTFSAILSDRVVGIGVWQEKVIPYVQIKGQAWMPDGSLPSDATKGVMVGEHHVPVENETEAAKIIETCQKAIKEGKPTFPWNGQPLPATSSLINAINDLYPKRPKERKPQSPTDTTLPSPQERNVIIIKENFEDVAYQVHRIPRRRKPGGKIPEQLRTSPKPHQSKGFDWLCGHYEAGSRGVLLADDMGLGKTWQALVFLAWLKQGMDNDEISRLPLLIVAPTGLLKNWEEEIKVHLKDGLGDIASVYGTAIQSYKRGQTLDTAKLKEADVVLTTYETLNKYQISFTAITFAAVVFDEMQKVKNPAAQITNAVSGLRADFWIGMTGTPVENRLADLWCISDILQPGWLGSVKHFSQTFEKPLTQTPPSYEPLEQLKQLIATPNENAPEFMLRRMKADTLEGLPQKKEYLLEDVMTAEQASLYTQAVNDARASQDRGAMLQALQRMRAISLHPDYQRLNDYASDQEFINKSARLKKVFSILEEIRQKKEKALLFVEYDAWHQSDFLPSLLKRHFKLPELPMTINGSVKGELRQERVKKFQEDRTVFDVMIISPKAGGVGLTLTAANHVIHLTRWWNPAVEDQATDRVYRIGQARNVHVYYPIAVHPQFQEKSFDKCLHGLLEKKRRLSKDVLLPAGESEDDWQSLFTAAIHGEAKEAFSLNEIGSFNPLQFEAYVSRRLQQALNVYGLRVRKTPKSWDGGADIIVENIMGNILAILQCKHSANVDAVVSGSPDVRRAATAYSAYRGIGAVITNAQVSNEDRLWNKENPARHLLIEKEACLMPELKVIEALQRQMANI